MSDRLVNAADTISDKTSTRTIADDTLRADSWAPTNSSTKFISQLKASPVRSKPDQVRATMTVRSIRLKQVFPILTTEGEISKIKRQFVLLMTSASRLGCAGAETECPRHTRRAYPAPARPDDAALDYRAYLGVWHSGFALPAVDAGQRGADPRGNGGISCRPGV